MALVDIETMDDANAYYLGAIIGVPQNGETKPYQILRFQGEPAGARVAPLARASDNDLSLVSWTAFARDCIITVPRLGSVEQGSHVYYLFSGAPRQWGRGLRPELILGGNLSGADKKHWATLATNLFNRKFTPLRQAFDDLDTGRAVGRSLHYHWSLVSREDVKYSLLMYKSGVVGWCETPKSVALLRKFSNLEPILQRALGKEVNIQLT